MFGIALFAFVLLWIGFFSVSEEVFAAVSRIPGDGGGGGGDGGRGSQTQTTIQPVNTTDECGVNVVGTTTTVSQYYSGRGYLVIRIIEQTHTTYPIGDTVDFMVVTNYSRQSNGALIGVQASGSGQVTFYGGLRQNIVLNRSFIIFPGEIAKVSREEIHTSTNDGVTETLVVEIRNYDYDSGGTLLHAAGNIQGGEKDLATLKFVNTFQAQDIYAIIGVWRRLMRVLLAERPSTALLMMPRHPIN